MALSFTVGDLRSRTVQTAIMARYQAGRIVKKGGGILAKIAKIGGFLFSKIVSYFNLNFDRLWDVLVDAYFTLKTFDWNATDQELQKQIERNNQQIVSAAAEGLGTALGWGVVRLANFFVGRFLPGKRGRQLQAVEGIKIPVVSARIGLALAEEGNEELSFQFRRFIGTASRAMVSNAFINWVLTARRNEWFGMASITEPKPNGSIAAKIDEQIEKLPEFWRKPVESFIDGFEDAIIEAGYVVAFSIDDHIAAMRWMQKEQGPYRTIEVKPHKDSDEVITFRGDQKEVMESIRTVLPTYEIVDNRDIGQFMGENPNEVISARPQLRALNLQYYGKPAPPYKKNGKWLGQRATISVPDAKPGLTAAEIRAVTPRYQYGDWYVHCKMDSGREMKGWFATHQEGIEVLTQLSKLSTSDIDPDSFRWSNGRSGNKKSERMHPGYAAIIYPRRKRGKNSGELGKGKRIPIWTDDPKDNGPLP